MKEQHEFDNHANLLNPNNEEFYHCRENSDWEDDYEDECDNNVLDEDIVEEYRDYSND